MNEKNDIQRIHLKYYYWPKTSMYYSQVEYHTLPVDLLQNYNWAIAPSPAFNNTYLRYEICKFTEEPIEVLKMAASIPRNKPRTPSALNTVESASKELL